MPSKADGTTANASNFKFVLTILKHCESINCDWQAAGNELGVKYGRNIASRFRELVKRHGYKLENNKMIKIDDGATDSTNLKKILTAPKTPKKEKHTTSRPTSSAKKCKVAVKKEDFSNEEESNWQAQDSEEDGKNSDQGGHGIKTEEA